ncbi:MAG: GNAT family N-acetyltransferase [Anaerolineae bacterium]|nr:GNAT family N-acetyltransferase [Anaerolineae bacterium]
MALATWWASDPLLDLTPLSDFHVRLAADDAQLAALNHITVAEVEQRRYAGHLPYMGYMGGTAVTYGWVATQEASIGELSLVFPIAAESRYLWDFATLPEWQGRGLYPRLLQAIVQAERAERFWIIHAPENLPSGAGIQKAGFQAVGQLSFQRDNSLGLIPFDPPERARIGAALLGVPVIESGLSPCWRCVEQVACTCQRDPESCSCAVELRLSPTTIPNVRYDTTASHPLFWG